METILILDQEPCIRGALKIFLESEKYTVIAVNTIFQACRSFSELKVSGLITEYRIDDSRTLETIKELKSRFPEAYVMMVTDSDLGEKEYEEIINAGVDDYFLKPFSFRRILFHLRKGLKPNNVLMKKAMASGIESNQVSEPHRETIGMENKN